MLVITDNSTKSVCSMGRLFSMNEGVVMSFVAGTIIGMFIGCWVGILVMCLCRISAHRF